MIESVVSKRLRQWRSKYEKKEQEYGYNYRKKDTMKRYVYYRCIPCGKSDRMIGAGASKAVLDHLVCSCGARRFTFITKKQYDDVTQKRNVITKGGVTKFKAPRSKINVKKLDTRVTYLEQFTNVSSETEEHEEAEQKEEQKHGKKKKRKRKDSDSRRSRRVVVTR